MIVSSTITSHTPRVQRNRDRSALVVPGRSRRKNAPSPAVNMNTGAQMCVIQRVKNSAAVVRDKSSGEKDIAPMCRKSRV